ncbi:MAG TPA: hypothetical protein VGG42_05455 [Acidobacteriaceae bacterium]
MDSLLQAGYACKTTPGGAGLRGATALFFARGLGSAECGRG